MGILTTHNFHLFSCYSAINDRRRQTSRHISLNFCIQNVPLVHSIDLTECFSIVLYTTKSKKNLICKAFQLSTSTLTLWEKFVQSPVYYWTATQCVPSKSVFISKNKYEYTDLYVYVKNYFGRDGRTRTGTA